MSTIFTRIINGEIPGTFVHRDEQCVAFLSINPLAHGHTLVVPIAEFDQWVDLPAELAAHLFEVSYRIGRAQQMAFQCQRVALIIAGYEVPHAHVHLIPSEHMGHLNFANAATTVDRTEMDDAALAIRVALRAQVELP